MQKKIDKPSENIEPRPNSGIRSLRHQAESELAEQEQTARPVDVSETALMAGQTSQYEYLLAEMEQELAIVMGSIAKMP